MPNPNKSGAVSVNENPPQVVVLRGVSFELPGLDSNQDKENQKIFSHSRKPLSGKDSGEAGTRFAHGFAQTDLDLTHILDTWPMLPSHIRAAILALVISVPLDQGR
ncbi:MAG TPA: hypothetical protein VGF55_18065 [Gemmataceae bacterium]